MKPYAEIDSSSFPIIFIRFTGNKSTDENFRTYLEQNKACYQEKKKLAIIFDASVASIPSFEHQKMQAEWLKENKALMQTFCAGTAYVIPNAAIRLILKGIFKIQQQPVPYKIFENEMGARAWVDCLDLS